MSVTSVISAEAIAALLHLLRDQSSFLCIRGHSALLFRVFIWSVYMWFSPEDSALLLSDCIEHSHWHCSNTPPVGLKRAEQSPKDLHYPPVFDRYSCVCAK